MKPKPFDGDFDLTSRSQSVSTEILILLVSMQAFVEENVKVHNDGEFQHCLVWFDLYVIFITVAALCLRYHSSR